MAFDQCSEVPPTDHEEWKLADPARQERSAQKKASRRSSVLELSRSQAMSAHGAGVLKFERPSFGGQHRFRLLKIGIASPATY